MSQLGTASQPLRVAIIGSGPSGFYAAEYLQKQADLNVAIDMFERLPTPYGLVRGGVAPDHQKIKSVTKVYERIAANPSFRYFGNVEFGVDITLADIQQHYHAVIYAVGSATDRSLGIPGEDLPGSHAATEFVGWYNAHPDYRDLQFDLSQECVAVIGVGNVAMDVARILGRTPTELQDTDIAEHALKALADSNVKEIYVLGRRGPAQAAFTNPEIKELGEMEGVDCIVYPDEVVLDEHSLAYLQSPGVDRKDVKNVDILQAYSRRVPEGKPRRIIMRFLASPVEIIGTDRVEAIRIVKNELVTDDRGNIRPRATDQFETIPVGLVFRSVGYKGIALPDVPFYEKWGTIPNQLGRVMSEHETGEIMTGQYVVGWIKRGPSGIIGTNKPDSVETAQQLLADVALGRVWEPTDAEPEAINALLALRKPNYVSFADWQVLDGIELARGAELGRPRLKFETVDAMLKVLEERQQRQPAGD